MINHALDLDMRKGGALRPRVAVRLGESRTQRVVAALMNGGASYVPGCDSARLLARMRSGALLEAAATVVEDTVAATLPVGDLKAPDRSRVAYIELAWADGRTETTEDFEMTILDGGN